MKVIFLLIAIIAIANIEADVTCSRNLDIGFVIDGSSSICKSPSCPEWKAILDFCQNIVSNVIIGPTNTRVALATLSYSLNVKWDLFKYKDASSLSNAIGGLTFPGGELIDPISTLSVLTQMFNPLIPGVYRQTAMRVGILVTDGAPDLPSLLYAIDSTTLQTLGDAVFVVCITPGCTTVCAEGIASPPKKANETIFYLDDTLKVDQVRAPLLNNICAFQVNPLGDAIYDFAYIVKHIAPLILT